jgi:hypothetical protein
MFVIEGKAECARGALTLSATAASSIRTILSVRLAGSIVVSHSCCGIISPSPLKRCKAQLTPAARAVAAAWAREQTPRRL